VWQSWGLLTQICPAASGIRSFKGGVWTELSLHNPAPPYICIYTSISAYVPLHPGVAVLSLLLHFTTHPHNHSAESYVFLNLLYYDSFLFFVYSHNDNA